MYNIPVPINFNRYHSSNWGLCCYWFTNSCVRHIVVTNSRELQPTVLWWSSNVWRHISWHSVSRFNGWSERTHRQTDI